MHLQSKQGEALLLCHVQGIRRSLLQEIWSSGDLWTIRIAVRVLSKIPEPFQTRFLNALKQMSG